MLTLANPFGSLLSNIEPDPQRAELAQTFPSQVRDFLNAHPDIQTSTPHSRLAGSYARHTTVKNIKDVDILLLVDKKYKDQKPEVVLDTLFSLLGKLPEALGDQGNPISRRHQRRSVNVHLKHADFDLDIVPVIAPEGLDAPLLVSDKEWNKWILTHPLGYAQKLSELNGAHKEKVVPLIKLVKHWRDVQMSRRRPKSYWLECLVYQAIATGKVLTSGLSYAELFAAFMGAVYSDFAPLLKQANKVPEILDPMLGNNVAFNWERADFESFMRRIEETCRWTEAALAYGNEDRPDAVGRWQRVFGEEWFYVEDEETRAKRLRDAAMSGTVAVTSTGRVMIGKPESQYVRPLPQRFYGA